MLRLVCNRTTNCHSFRYYRKPTALEKARYVTASMIVARFGGSIRLSAVQVGKALKDLGFEQVHTRNGRFWLVVERSQDEINHILPESVTDVTGVTDVF